MFSKIYNYNNIIYNIIKKQLSENILLLKVYILSENKQAGLNLKNYIKKKINVFLFYNNYVNNCNIKLIILNKEIIMSIINKNN